jgi:hypothetical protein
MLMSSISLKILKATKESSMVFMVRSWCSVPTFTGSLLGGCSMVFMVRPMETGLINPPVIPWFKS